MKKKLLAVILSLLVASVLVACGSSANDTNSNDDVDAKEESTPVVTPEKDKEDVQEENTPEVTPEGDKEEAPEEIKIDLSNAKAGDTLEFGSVTRNIQWNVLEADDESVLLISRYGYKTIYAEDGSVKYFDESEKNGEIYLVSIHATNWAESDAREWLNGEFLEKNFTEEEQARIQVSTISNPGSAEFYAKYYPNVTYYENKNVCGDTEDKVYILNWEELVKYYGVEQIGDEVYVSKSFDGIGENGVLDGKEFVGYLRSTGENGNLVLYAGPENDVKGVDYRQKITVHPVIRVKR